VRGAEIAVEIDGRHRAEGMSDRPFAVPAYGETRVVVPVIGDDPALAQRVTALRSADAPPLTYRIEGGVIMANDLPPLRFSASGRLHPPAAVTGPGSVPAPGE
jgi:hypothetical protein